MEAPEAPEHRDEPASALDKADTPADDKPDDKTPHDPVRIFVRCLSHHIPGPQKLRRTAMGDLICQHIWGRDMDNRTDLLRDLGCPDADGEKVKFLLDSGPPGAEPSVDHVPVLAYRWNGEKMLKRKAGARSRAYLSDNFPFKTEPQRSPPPSQGGPKTLAERRAAMSDGEFSDFLERVVEAKLRFHGFISTVEKEWMQANPAAFDRLMRQHVARRLWYELPLGPSEQMWLDAHPLGPGDAVSDPGFLGGVVDMRQGEIRARHGMAP